MISPETFARYASMRVPRYTSYPTAPNFSATINHDEYGRRLEIAHECSDPIAFVFKARSGLC
jgi:hypothetical protein